MRKGKKCPNCKTENDKEEYNCIKCGYDLSNVPVTTIDDDPKPDPKPDPLPVPPKPDVGRKCNQCGHVSPLKIMLCPQCNNDLSSSPIVRMPISGQKAAKKAKWQIVSTDQLTRLEISEGQHILIGWAFELGSYFSSRQKDYVSNRHGKLSVLKDCLYFEDNSSNGTMINNRPIPKGQAQHLSEGDVLCLGGRPSPLEEAAAAYFRVERS